MDARDTASMVTETARRILRDLADPQTINNAKDASWKAPLWRALEEAGLTLAWVPEEFGGAGAEMADGFGVLHEAGRFVVPVALAETLLAGCLLSRAGLGCPKGVMTVAPVRPNERIALDPDGTLNGQAHAVPFASEAAHIVVMASHGRGHSIALLDETSFNVMERPNIAGDPASTLRLDGVRPLAVQEASGLDPRAFMLIGAAVRSMQMAGALQAILDLAVKYANERVAFERPLAKFQAVQHNLARLAGEVAAAVASAGSAAATIGDAAGQFDDAVLLEVASAKIRVGEAAHEGAAIAHQVHGAIGFTQEHVLHRFTRRLWAWRDDFGGESFWAVELGAMVARRGGDELWPLLASR